MSRMSGSIQYLGKKAFILVRDTLSTDFFIQNLLVGCRVSETIRMISPMKIGPCLTLTLSSLEKVDHDNNNKDDVCRMYVCMCVCRIKKSTQDSKLMRTTTGVTIWLAQSFNNKMRVHQTEESETRKKRMTLFASHVITGESPCPLRLANTTVQKSLV